MERTMAIYSLNHNDHVLNLRQKPRPLARFSILVQHRVLQASAEIAVKSVRLFDTGPAIR